MNELLEYNREENDLLKSSVRKAELLLAYSAEKGIALTEDEINAIIEIKKMLDSGSATKDAIIEFWMAFNIISKKIRPVNINSILASKEMKIEKHNFFSKLLDRRYRSSLAHKSVRRYMIFAVISMVGMLILQIYALKGTTLLDNIKSWENRQNDISDRLIELSMMIDDEGNNMTAISEQAKLNMEVEELGKKISTGIFLLEDWLDTGSLFVVNPNKIASKALNQSKRDIIEGSLDLQKTRIKQEALNLTLILGLYILPLLYGLLGGVVYVLRALVDEVKELIFSKESTIKYTLRILLGAIFGLSIGLFWDDVQAQQSGFVASLSLLFVAFITGYSVEYLFFVIDRLAGKITGKRVETDEEIIPFNKKRK